MTTADTIIQEFVDTDGAAVDFVRLVWDTGERRPLSDDDLCGPMAAALAELYPEDTTQLADGLVGEFCPDVEAETSPGKLISAGRFGDRLLALVYHERSEINFGARYLIALFGMSYSPFYREDGATLYAGALTAVSRQILGVLASDPARKIEISVDDRLAKTNTPMISSEDTAAWLLGVKDVLTQKDARLDEETQDIMDIADAECVNVNPCLGESRDISSGEQERLSEFIEMLPYIYAGDLEVEPPRLRGVVEGGEVIASLVDLSEYHTTTRELIYNARENSGDKRIDEMIARTIRYAEEGRAHMSKVEIGDGVRAIVSKVHGSNDRVLRGYLTKIGIDDDGFPLYVLLGVARTKEGQEGLLRLIELNSPKANQLR